MPVATFKERVRYRVDTFLARGSGALLASLVITFLGAITVFAILRLIVGLISPDAERDFLQQVWTAFLQLTAPGNMNQDTRAPGLFKAVAVVAGLTGVVIFSTLIAFLTTAVNQALRQLQRGHSRVLEAGHTLILGWGPRVAEILRELFEANESERDCRRPRYVSLAAQALRDRVDG